MPSRERRICACGRLRLRNTQVATRWAVMAHGPHLLYLLLSRSGHELKYLLHQSYSMFFTIQFQTALAALESHLELYGIMCLHTNCKPWIARLCKPNKTPTSLEPALEFDFRSLWGMMTPIATDLSRSGFSRRAWSKRVSFCAHEPLFCASRMFGRYRVGNHERESTWSSSVNSSRIHLTTESSPDFSCPRTMGALAT